MIDTLILDREEMTESERELFLSDLNRVCDEYFDCDKKFSLDVTRTESGYSVCVIFDARRIKRLKKPQ
ncbi:MAG: hypothetical protein ACI4L9_04185 [Candidatus Coproplasma sp.]